MSLGVTALSMAKDPFISGNIALKNEFRAEMGDIPSTQLEGTQETVSQYRNRVRQSRKIKCARGYRNDLVDLCSVSEDEDRDVKLADERKTKMKKRVMMKLLMLHKESKDGAEKAKIKAAMKALDGKYGSNKNEMIELIFDVHTSEIESFDSGDAVTHILDFVSDNE